MTVNACLNFAKFDRGTIFLLNLINMGRSFHLRGPSHPLQKYIIILTFIVFLLGGGLGLYATVSYDVFHINLLRTSTVLMNFGSEDVINIPNFYDYHNLTVVSCPYDVPIISSSDGPLVFSAGPAPTSPDAFSFLRFALNTDSQVNVSISSPASMLLFSSDTSYRKWRGDKKASHALVYCVSDQCQPNFVFTINKNLINYRFVFHNPSRSTLSISTVFTIILKVHDVKYCDVLCDNSSEECSILPESRHERSLVLARDNSGVINQEVIVHRNSC
ncbi:hypothetical protein GEMRC1_013995 [Eukaryota sp. GEM-RC1]